MVSSYGNIRTVIIEIWDLFNSSPSDKMATILADNIFTRIVLNEYITISIQISLKFVPKGPVDNNPALVQIMAWHQKGDKPLSKPMLTRFTDAYMRHYVEGDELTKIW